jgi:hypothetical protein
MRKKRLISKAEMPTSLYDFLLMKLGRPYIKESDKKKQAEQARRMVKVYSL